MIDTLYTNGYHIIKNFFDENQTDYFLFQSIDTIEKKEVYLGSENKDNIVHPMTWNVNSHPIWQNTLYSVLGNVEKAVDEKLIPIYSYQRTYLKGAEMSHHSDWPWCQISLTINLGQSHSYPIYVTDLQTKKSKKVIQKPGDAILYLGNNVSHYRNKFKGDWYSQLFLHYVLDNPTMKQYQRFDGDDFQYDFEQHFDSILYTEKVKEKMNNIKYDMILKDKDRTTPIDASMFKTSNKKPKIFIDKFDTDVHMMGGQYSAKNLNFFMDSTHQTNGALPPNFCKELIDLYEDYSSKGEVYSGLTHKGLDDDTKNTGELDLMLIPEGERYIKVLGEVSDLCIYNYVRKFGMLQHYNPDELDLNGHYYPMWEIHKYEKGIGHYEAWHTEGSHLYEYGNRVFTSMFYLNDVKEGGRTVFPYANKAIRCQEGKHFAFPTSFPYVHYAETPQSEDKYILTSWWQTKWPEEYMSNFIQLEKFAKHKSKEEVKFIFEEEPLDKGNW